MARRVIVVQEVLGGRRDTWDTKERGQNVENKNQDGSRRGPRQECHRKEHWKVRREQVQEMSEG